MKKIFAIALALVMVLSMASAFAAPCATGPFDWTETAADKCGRAKVEVVPYVKVNDGCGGFTWQVSECAAAVASEKVYYAYKLTVDANPDAEWFGKLEGNGVKVTTKGFADNVPATCYLPIQAAVYASTNTEEAVYYWNGRDWDKVGTGAGEISVADDVEATPTTPYIFGSEVKNASKAKLCAALVSKNADFKSGIVGKFFVEYVEDETMSTTLPTEGMIQDEMGPTKYAEYTKCANWKKQNVTLNPAQQAAADAIFAEYDAAKAKLTESVKADLLKVSTVENGAADETLAIYYIYDGKVYDIASWNVCGYTYADVEAFFGIKIGTKINKDLLKKNFGWDDKVEDCFAWKSNTPAIVDAECVVAIPKTGDASVLAWLF